MSTSGGISPADMPVSGDSGSAAATAPSALLRSPDRGSFSITTTINGAAGGAASSPLQRRIRQTRLLTQSSPSSLLAPGSPTGTSATHAAAAATGTTSSRLGCSMEAMAPRTVLKPTTTTASTNTSRQTTTSWQPTRLTSSYCVLSAAGVQEDFYTTALSWGTHQMALALEQSLVLFHPSRPRQSSSTVQITQKPADTNNTYASSAFSYPRRATAVAMSRCREISSFLGLSNGAVELYEGRGDGGLYCTVVFAMPEPPTDYLSSLIGGADGRGISCSSTATLRAARALALLSSSVSSVSCVGTSDRHPWLGAAATAARGLVALDGRQTQPVLRFGGEGERGSEAQSITYAGSVSAAAATADASTLPSPLSMASTASTCGDGNGLSRLQRVSAFLRRHDRLCSVSWNATGSLVATGSSAGIVKVWSLSASQRPLQSFLVDHECTVKALCFHPERPYELLVGGSAGPAGLRTYDLSSAEPVLTCCGATAAPVTQAVYDPAGHYAVTCAGAPADPAVSFSLPLPPSSSSQQQQQRLPQSAARSDANSPIVGSSAWDGSPRWRLSSPSHSAATGVSFGPTPAVPLLQDSWEDDIDAAAVGDTLPLIGATDGLSSSISGLLTSTAHHAPANAVVLWRCGSRCRDNYLRDALFCERAVGGREGKIDEDDEDNDDGEHLVDDDDVDGCDERTGRDRHPSIQGEWRVGGRVSAAPEGDSGLIGEEGGPRLEWLPMTSLPGHRARPLLLCAPFPQSPFSGCYASLAAGDDCTIRFWRLFETSSDATHWQHRRQAQQRSATTQEDMDLFTTPVLR